MRLSRLVKTLLLFVCMAVADTALAQAPATPAPQIGPSNNTDLGLVVATGNSRSTSVGFRNVYGYRRPEAEFQWEAGWLRVASRDGDRYAVGTPSAFEVVEPGTAIDSERLFSKVRYQHQLSPRTDWFANFDAARDEPSNLERQFVLAGGLGTTWHKTDDLTFRTAYGMTYTDEKLELEGVNRFAGYRLFYGLKAAIAAATTGESELTFDGSFDTGDDMRSDWLNSVSVAINSKLALKASVRLLFRNLPARQTLNLLSPAKVAIGTIDVPKEQVDTNITTSLVITF